MLNLIDKAVSYFSPHGCMSCGLEPEIACSDCLEAQIDLKPASCIVCGKLNKDSSTCTDCRSSQSCEVVYSVCGYKGLAKDLIMAAKYQTKYAAYKPIADLMVEPTPSYFPDFVVCGLPTSNKHIRQRGFDYVQAVGRSVAKQKQLAYHQLLIRLKNNPQVGLDRQQRKQNIKGAFRVCGDQLPNKVLLIDDVLTTGSTMNEAAKTLRRAGVKHVCGLVLCHNQG